MPARPLLDPASSRAHRSSLPHCGVPPARGHRRAARSHHPQGAASCGLTTRDSAARHSLVPASLLPFTDFSQYSGIHGTKRQTSPTPSTDRSLWRPPVLAAAAALSPSWARRHRSRRTPRQLLVEVTAVEDGMSCGCEGAQAALGSSLALRRTAERSSDRSAAGSPSPARRDDHAASFDLRSMLARL